MEYKVGDKVVIVSNKNDHEFDIGEVVTIRDIDSDGNIDSCHNGKDYWYIDNCEVKPYTPPQTNTPAS